MCIKILKKSILIFLITFVQLLMSCHETGVRIPVYQRMVVPVVDAVNSRWFYFTSASRPFGMVNSSPDTQIRGAWGSGYRYNVDTVKGFSHVHGWQLAGPSVMPVIHDSVACNCSFKDYFSGFSHQSEEIRPGYHQLFLDRYSIVTELTSTKRVGFHRYTLKEDRNVAILFNLNGELGPSLMANGLIQQTENKYQITGQVTNKPTFRRPKDCTVFFTAKFNIPIRDVQKDSVTGNYMVCFDKIEDKRLLMKIAISYTSVENAELNLKEELPGWDFDQVVRDSEIEWNNLLSRIEVEGGSEEQQKRFYTDLWHALQGRRIISDLNGAYPDNTGQEFRIGQLPLNKQGKPLFNHYNSDSFWGAQWTINTLWGLVYPEVTEEFVHSLIQYYKDGGLIPRGPSGGNYTYVMTGASSTPFIVSAIQKGIVKENLEDIYMAVKKNHMPGGIMERAGYEHETTKGGGLTYYLNKGYVPYPIPEGNFGAHQDGVSLTLEYAYQDWTLAQLAKKLGYNEDAEYFLKRSRNYVNVFDSKSGWMRPKDENGNWNVDFDPYQAEHGFIESNAAQATWFVPHDLTGLAKLVGDDEKASDKLNQSFEAAQKLGLTAGTSHELELHPDCSRIPINYGNQPSVQTSFIFNYLHKPWLTQYWSREVVEAVYEGITPQSGYNGDEDQGLMGSLAVLMKIGLFSMKGGCSLKPQLELGSPVFDKITIHLNPEYYKGKTISIKTIGNSSENRFIQSAMLNDKELNTWCLSQDTLVDGAELVLQMGNQPNRSWGID